MQQQKQTSTQSTSQSTDILAAKRIKHTRIGDVMMELDTLIYPGSKDSILLVCGPSGAGKTTLSRFMVSSALERARLEMEANRGIIPAIYVEAPSSGENNFSWRMFYQRILAELGDEMDYPKVVYGVDPESGRMVKPRGSSGNTLAALRSAVERGLKARGVQFLVIDEAAHIIRQTRGEGRLEIQLDTLKSLANTSGAQMIMVGAYDLYKLVSLSGQIARRTHVLHFSRYREDHPEDVRAFERCVSAFEKTLPDLWGGKLSQHSKALMRNTLGCVGTLSDVLKRAARLADASGGWSEEALERALLTEAQRRKILDEILDGEAAIEPSFIRILDSSEAQTKQKKQQ
ncbi:ATP-binding protein [Paraburkholderia sp. SIMBA_027]|uniref:ATP-binding protein n=1 Tax=Paraburkholderia sp. SIMBA_027 TaxID=3085770 RepID=UPI00397B8419